jgi:hypothetical protein
MSNSNQEPQQNFKSKITATHEQALIELSIDMKRRKFYSILISLVSQIPNDMELGSAVREYVNKQQESLTTCYDRFGKVISAGDFVDVQLSGTTKVYSKNGELYFKPYGEEERVMDYFSNDLEVV